MTQTQYLDYMQQNPVPIFQSKTSHVANSFNQKSLKTLRNDQTHDLSEQPKLSLPVPPLDSPSEVGTCVATARRAISASSLTSMVEG